MTVPVRTVSAEGGELYLLIRVGTQLCALLLEHVVETMRPQPVCALAGTPPFLRGVSVIRGEPVPVIDAACALGADRPSADAARFVALRTADRRVALAVDHVIGVRQVNRTQLSELPPLLAGLSDEVISAFGMLDSELLMVLRSGKLVPEAVWTAIEAGGAR